MNKQDYWQLFLETGAPEVYLMFHNARKQEEDYVFNRTRTSSAGNSLQ